MPQRETSGPAVAGIEPEALAALNRSGETLTRPIYDAIQSLDLPSAKTAWKSAVDALEGLEVSPDVREALGYKLFLLECNLRFIGDDERKVWNADSLREVEGYLSQPAETVLGNAERLRSLLTVLIHADQDGLQELSRERFEMLFAELPPEYRGPGFYQMLTKWAFKHRYLSILERAFEEFLTNPDQVMGSAKWQRINLMYQLVLGKATRRDVLETIRSLAIAPQVEEFALLLWPACVEAGLTDPELEAMFKARAKHLRATAPAPRGERRTQSVRTGPVAK